MQQQPVRLQHDGLRAEVRSGWPVSVVPAETSWWWDGAAASVQMAGATAAAAQRRAAAAGAEVQPTRGGAQRARREQQLAQRGDEHRSRNTRRDLVHREVALGAPSQQSRPLRRPLARSLTLSRSFSSRISILARETSSLPRCSLDWLSLRRKSERAASAVLIACWISPRRAPTSLISD